MVEGSESSSNNQTDASVKPISSSLNAYYSFENFVKTDSNHITMIEAQLVCENLGQFSHNPLFIFASFGLGKTHLLHAVGNCAQKKYPDLKILYVPAEQFSNELVNKIKQGKLEEFRNLYRSLDLLLIDDIQYITGRPATMEEFSHTLDSLTAAGKQVVISSDRNPSSMKVLDERLRSRYKGGVITNISAPDENNRFLILKEKARSHSIVINDQLLQLIAKTVTNNVRDLEGALNSLVSYSQHSNSNLNTEAASQILRELGFDF